MKSLNIDNLGKIKTIAYIPTIEEKYSQQLIIIIFEDGSLSEYIFEINEETKYKSLEEYAKDIFNTTILSKALENFFESVKKDIKLRNIIRKEYKNVKEVYVGDL
jgi:hypothetical protein